MPAKSFRRWLAKLRDRVPRGFSINLLFVSLDLRTVLDAALRLLPDDESPGEPPSPQAPDQPRPDGYGDAPGMRAVYAHMRQRCQQAGAPDVLISVSSGGMLAASLLSRWTGIPLGSVVRTSPRSQTLTGGHKVRRSEVVAATDLRELAGALGRPKLRLALVEDVCRTGRSILMAAEFLTAPRWGGIVERVEALALVAGQGLDYGEPFELRGEGGQGVLSLPLSVGAKEEGATIVMPWEAPMLLAAGGASSKAATGLLDALTQRFREGRAPDVFVAISNGGAVLASHLALHFNLPAACVTRSSPHRQWVGGGHATEDSHVLAWPDAEGMEALFASPAGRPEGSPRRVMLVDDIARSGDTLLEAVEATRKRLPTVAVDACLLYLGARWGPDEFCAALKAQGCDALVYGATEPAPGIRLPWDVRPQVV